MRIVVLGSGAMGLAAAFQGVCDGHDVTLLEADAQPGGMAAHFDFGGLSIEKFYHFICKTDVPTFDLLRELGIEDKLHWRSTSMGLYTQGKLNPWGDPVALLKMPGMSLLDKLRYGFFIFISSKRNTWPSLEHRTAREWIVAWCGEPVYRMHWHPLFSHKFYEFQDHISAAWIWTRIQRLGRSRKNLMHEQLGYLEGGSQTLVNAFVSAIQARGGKLHLSSPALSVLTANGRVTAVQTTNGPIPADAVISTVPTPLISRLVPDLSPEARARYDAIPNIGICCLVFKLKRSLSPHFWINFSDPAIEIPGLIEFSNLRPVDDHIVYIPYYMPTGHPKFSWPDDQLLAQAFLAMQAVQPDLQSGDILDARVARLRYAQPICTVNFAASLPPIQTSIAGLQIADTCFYYPQDRGIAESIRLGRSMAQSLKPLAL